MSFGKECYHGTRSGRAHAGGTGADLRRRETRCVRGIRSDELSIGMVSTYVERRRCARKTHTFVASTSLGRVLRAPLRERPGDPSHPAFNSQHQIDVIPVTAQLALARVQGNGKRICADFDAEAPASGIRDAKIFGSMVANVGRRTTVHRLQRARVRCRQKMEIRRWASKKRATTTSLRTARILDCPTNKNARVLRRGSRVPPRVRRRACERAPPRRAFLRGRRRGRRSRGPRRG